MNKKSLFLFVSISMLSCTRLSAEEKTNQSSPEKKGRVERVIGFCKKHPFIVTTIALTGLFGAGYCIRKGLMLNINKTENLLPRTFFITKKPHADQTIFYPELIIENSCDAKQTAQYAKEMSLEELNLARAALNEKIWNRDDFVYKKNWHENKKEYDKKWAEIKILRDKQNEITWEIMRRYYKITKDKLFKKELV